MHTDTPTRSDPVRGGLRISTVGAVMRLVLGLTVCVLAWLCVRASLATEQVARMFHPLFRSDAPSDMSGFLWQHPRLLFAFAVAIALGSVGYLALARVHRRAALVAGVGIVILLVQWLVVTPAVSGSAMGMMQRAARETRQ